MKKWLATALATLILSPAQAQTLTMAVSQAVRENPIIRTELARYQQRRYEASAQRGAYLPTIGLSARYGQGQFESETNGISQDSDQHSYQRATITLSQLIWDGNLTVERINQASSEADYQRLQVAAAASEIGLRTVRAYNEVLLSQQLVTLAEQNVIKHRQIAADISRRAESGAGTSTDTSQVEGRLAQAEASLISAQNNLRDAESSYLRYVGDSPLNLIPPESVDTSALPNDLAGALKLAAEQNPLIASAHMSIKAAKHEVGAQRGSFSPAFAFEANRMISHDYDYVGVRNDDWSAELVMSYNLYRGGADLNNLQASASALEAVRYDSDRALREVQDELRLAWNARESINNQLPYLQRHIETSEQTKINYRKQFDIGRRTLLDLLDSENEFYRARQALLQAQYDLTRADYRLLASTGALLDTLEIELIYDER